MQRRVLLIAHVVLVGVLFSGIMQGAWPAIASASHTCGDVWCSGSDGSTANNVQGNNPQVYLGEIGVYLVDIGHLTGPCTGYPNHVDSCFNPSGANGAESVQDNGNGLGVQFYYFGGGANSQYNDAPSPYCWGWEQGQQAIHNIHAEFNNRVTNRHQMLFLDVEQPLGDYGWGGSGADNRAVFNGFRDYVQGAQSDQPGNCPNDNDGDTFQHAAYASPEAWNGAMGSAHNDLSNTPVWTYQTQGSDDWPGDFHRSGSVFADWFGTNSDNDNHDVWQFHQGPDHDILNEPVHLPWFNVNLGT